MKDSVASAGSSENLKQTKKLKQARLPFQIISPDSPKVTPQIAKKRKLSVDHDSSTKVDLKENNDEVTSVRNGQLEPVVISDDEDAAKVEDIGDAEDAPKVILNPFVSLVDGALKRKLAKVSAPKKKRKIEKKTSPNRKSNRRQAARESDSNDVEIIDVDVKTDDAKELQVSSVSEEVEKISETKEKASDLVEEIKESKIDDDVVIVDEPDNLIEDDVKTSECKIDGRTGDSVSTEKTDDLKVDEPVNSTENENKTSECKVDGSTADLVSTEKTDVAVDEPVDPVKIESKTLKRKNRSSTNLASSTEKSVVKVDKHVNSAKDKKKTSKSKVDSPAEDSASSTEKTDGVVDEPVNSTEDKIKTSENKVDSSAGDSTEKNVITVEESEGESESEKKLDVEEEKKYDVEEEKKDDVEEEKKDDVEEEKKDDVDGEDKEVKLNTSDDQKSLDSSKTSIDSEMTTKLTTPKSNKTQSKLSPNDGPKAAKRSPITSVDLNKLTPKQRERKLEALRKHEEKEREKRERERERLHKKFLKDAAEEEKRKEKEEREEAKRKEKEEKERIKEEERLLKETKEQWKRQMKEMQEKQKKDQKEAREEERKRRELEKEEEKKRKELEKEEIENRKKKVSMAFVSFFVSKDKTQNANTSSAANASEVSLNKNYLSHFTIKSDMRLAPLTREQLSNENKKNLDLHLAEQKVRKNDLYVRQIKSDDYKIKRSGKTWPLEDLKNDVMIIEDDLPPIDDTKNENEIIMEDHHLNLRPKMLSFAENRRPPYWGTWRRKSQSVSGRRPFAMDKSHLDYSCDSDDEWEEEEPGESVGGSVAGSVGDEEDDEYDVDNEFMVPHGYLSEEEALGEDDDKVLSPETQKAKLKFMECEFENERKKTTERLHPRLLGIVWQNSDGGKPDTCAEAVWNFLNVRKILSSEAQINVKPITDNDTELDDSMKKPDKFTNKKYTNIKDAMIPDLIKLVHCNSNGRGFLASEFQAYLSKMNLPANNGEGPQENEDKSETSKVSIARKIKDVSKWMSCPEEGAMLGKMCWFVEKDIREKYELNNLEVPNNWVYALTPKRKLDTTKEKIKVATTKAVDEKETPVHKKDNAFDIKKFTKILTQEDKDKQFASPVTVSVEDDKKVEPKSDSAKASPAVVQKKRVALLFSGPRGKSLPSADPKNDPPESTDKKKVDEPRVLEKNDSIETSDGKKKTKETDKQKKSSEPRVKKRVSFNDSPRVIKTNLLTQFIKTLPPETDESAKKKEEEVTNGKKDNKEVPMEVDDCVILID